MKKNILQKIISFTVKYIWILCVILIITEIGSTVFSANILMQQTSQGVIQSVGGEISGRVNEVLRLLTGLSNDNRFNDTSVNIFDRALLTIPYKESYNLFMIAITDKDINVSSSNNEDKYYEPFNLAHRDYLQRLYASGTYQITDAFTAGADGTTMNYTIAVPILKNGTVEGSIFGSIYFDDIKEILNRNTSDDNNRLFYLLGAEHTLMADGVGDAYSKSLDERGKTTRYLTTIKDETEANWREGISKSFWEWSKYGLCYTTSMRVNPTNWTLVYQVQFFPVLASLLPILISKTCFYLLLCGAISLFGRHYLRRQLDEVSHLWDKLTAMQKELFKSEQNGFNDFLEMTTKGLTDQLTGLATRSVLFNKTQQLFNVKDSIYAVFFLDLDELKCINDQFGHDTGDCALVYFSKVLKMYEEKYNGFACRYGGDEFILIIKVLNENQILELANNLCNDLRISLPAGSDKMTIHGSIGISIYPQHGEKIEDLICKADIALYMAKQGGRNRYALYENSANAALLH